MLETTLGREFKKEGLNMVSLHLYTFHIYSSYRIKKINFNPLRKEGNEVNTFYNL